MGWNQIRNNILKRDGGECQVCGWQRDLEVHHIIPRIHGGGDHPNNLVTLCRECHDLVSENKHHIYDYPELSNGISIKNRIKYYNLLKQSKDPTLADIIKWADLKHNRICKVGDLKRIQTFFNIINKMGYNTEIELRFRENGRIRMKWYVDVVKA